MMNVSSGLSLEGEELVDGEVRQALYGVKQMKEVMTRNEEKHEYLMKSLWNSGEKKKVRDHTFVRHCKDKSGHGHNQKINIKSLM